MKVDQTPRQFREMVRQFITIYHQHKEIDAIQVTRNMYHKWGLSADWHPVADVLEIMTQRNEAHMVGTGPDRFTLYVID